jgi:hypothetical protein
VRTTLKTLLAFLLSTLAASASAFPGYVNYQGKLGDPSGNPRTGVYSFRFKIFGQATGGTALFSEDVTGADALSVSNGLYSVQIGSYTAGGVPLSALSGAESWLEIDVNSGASLAGAETLLPRERLASSPFALRALSADSLSPEVTISTINATTATTYGGVVVSTNLLVLGGLRFPGSVADGFRTPVGSVVPTKIGVPLYDPGNFGQVFAMGVPAGAWSTARAMLMLDARAFPHQPTILTLSPNESEGVGFSFDGDDNSAYLKSSVGLVFRLGGLITGNDVMSFKPTGMIGIGTTSQAARLHVSSANAVAADSVFLVSSGTAAGQELLVVKGDGKVGIGTADPLSKLQVLGGAIRASKTGSAGSLLFERTDGKIGALAAGQTSALFAVDDTAAFNIQFRSRAQIEAESYAGPTDPTVKLVMTSAGNMGIGAAPGSSFAAKLFVDGRTGIGTPDPAASLHVSSANAVAADVLLEVSSGTGVGQELLVVKGDGKVGIGTTGPSAKLEVAGTDTTNGFRVTGSNSHWATVYPDAAGNIYFQSDTSFCYLAPGGSSLICPSDRRLKKNVKSIGSALDLVSRLRPVTFDAIAGGPTQAGFIAQEVLEVIPGAVYPGLKGNYALSYEHFIPYGIKAIQELKTENEVLRARVEDLERRFAEREKRKP